MTVLGWLALMPQALAGHSAVSRDHMKPINALAVHLIAVTSWVGGLLALAIMSRSLAPPSRGHHRSLLHPRRLVVCRDRPSAACSPRGSTSLRSGTWPRHMAPMLIVKASALVLLGVAGWWHRRRLIARLDTDADDRTAFVRLVLR